MKIERKDLDNSIIELTIEEDAKAVSKHRKKVIDYLRKNADIKWFRKGGNIPENIIIQNYWEEKVLNMTVEFAIDDIYRKALIKENIIPVAQWEITEIISQSPLKFKLQIEVLPKVEIDNKYKKIKLTKKVVKVEASEVKSALKEIEKKFTTFIETTDKKSKAQMWDKVTIDTDWYDKDGKILETTSMRDYPIVLWSNVLVPGFEEWIVWYSTGDKIELYIKFPDDYHNESFKWLETKFKITIKKLEKATPPEFTEEFIEKLRGQKLDLAGFKKLIKTELTETKQQNTKLEEENQLIDELLKVTKISIWPKLIENQIEKLFKEIKENMSGQGIKIDKYLESLKLTEEEYKKQHISANAKRRVEWELILNKLMELEKTEVSDKELKDEIETIKKAYQNEEVLKRLEELYTPWSKHYEELKIRLGYRNLIDSFFETKKK